MRVEDAMLRETSRPPADNTCAVPRRLFPLGVHVRNREPHQPVEHQRDPGASRRPHLHPAEGAAVCGGRDQHQRGRHGVRRPPHRVAVADRRGDARCSADPSAGLPGEAGPAAGQRGRSRGHSGGSHGSHGHPGHPGRRVPAQPTKERRGHGERRGERSTRNK
uniref:Uncharacterized protein n=1 Tax=Rousettus aegyptiacus TaxID=9407 RepID=A0A7J8B785_ROUAE|nr:hypothetical protein HJG63_010022 [Rousettus aegyptiacus]